MTSQNVSTCILESFYEISLIMNKGKTNTLFYVTISQILSERGEMERLKYANAAAFTMTFCLDAEG